MLTLAKIAVINFLAFLLVIWLVKSAVSKEGVSLNTGAFMGVWMVVSLLLWFATVAWFIWSL